MDKHYTLTGRHGVFSAGSNRVTVIGQSDGCDVKIINHTKYEDVIFAKIKPTRNGDGWYLVKVSPYFPIIVNGIEMNRVHFLADGDNLEFPNGVIRFNIQDGIQNEPMIIHIHKNGKMLWGMAMAVVLIAVIVGYQIFDSQRENLTSVMKQEIEASLFKIRVDSLKLWNGDEVIDSYSYASSPTGTAFLTTDSLLITARHCIQPWLNQVSPLDYADIPMLFT